MLPVVHRIGRGSAGLSGMTALAFGVVIISGGLGTFMNFGDEREMPGLASE
jgi:hypothetical protein